MSASALVFPVRNAAGDRFYLSAGQRVTLTYVHHRVRGHGPVTLRHAAAILGTTPGVVSKRLDRLAQLGLIGRRSIRGRHGRTLLWIPGARRVAMRRVRRELGCACNRCRRPVGNVPTSTPFGGFLTREGLTGPTAGPEGGGASAATLRPMARRRTEPPRLLYIGCPAGHRTRATRTSYVIDRGAVVGSWAGWCSRCGGLARESVTYRTGADLRRGLTPISEVLNLWRK